MKTTVRTYRRRRRMERGIRKMEAQGWSVLTIAQEPQGCVGRWLNFYKGTPYLVTFQRQG